jgi:hypothetical protein
MVQKLSPKGTGIALALIIFIVSILCFLAVLLLGDISINFFNLFFHGIDLSGIRTTPNIIQGLIGTAILTIVGFILGWLYAIIYNKYSK